MNSLLARFRFSRLLAAVLLANLSSLVAMNGLTLAPVHLVLVYPCAFAAFHWVLSRAQVRRPRFAPSAGMLALCGAAFLLLTVPRAPYLLEWLPDNPVLAQADDYGHLAELVAMTHSERYPLRHPSNQAYLLSHYYTAFFPMALLKQAVPVLTLKDCLFVGNALYHFLILLSLLEVSTRLLPNRRAATLFLFLCTLFGGADWVFSARQLFGHAEFWTRGLFHTFREVSSYYTGLYWVIHHFAGLWSIVLAVVLAGQVRFRNRRVKPLLCGLLTIAACFTSPFAFLPALLLGMPELLRLLRRTWRTATFPILAAVFLVPLFLFTNRVQPGALRLSPVHLGLVPVPALDALVSCAIYVLLVCVVDLGGIPLALLFFWRRLRGREPRYVLVSMAFLCSTAFVESIGYGNYCMRGMFLPTFVFYLFGARMAADWRVPRAVWACALLLTFTGTLKECAFLTYQPLMFSRFYWRVRGLEPPARVAQELRSAYPAAARETKTRYYTPDAGDRHGLNKFNAEKMIYALPVAEMDGAEFELLRHPRRNWVW